MKLSSKIFILVFEKQPTKTPYSKYKAFCWTIFGVEYNSGGKKLYYPKTWYRITFHIQMLYAPIKLTTMK